MTTKTIYIITDGEYSDYSIKAVFTSHVEAEKYCKYYKELSKYHDPQIEEWPLNIDLSPLDRGEKMYRFWGMRDRTSVAIADDIRPESIEWFGMSDKYLFGHMWSDSEERVVKVISEKVAQILAMDLWGKNEALEMFWRNND